MKTSNLPIRQQVSDLQDKWDKTFYSNEHNRSKHPEKVLEYRNTGEVYEEVKLYLGEDQSVKIHIWDSENTLGTWDEGTSAYQSLESIVEEKLKEVVKLIKK